MLTFCLSNDTALIVLREQPSGNLCLRLAKRGKEWGQEYPLIGGGIKYGDRNVPAPVFSSPFRLAKRVV